MTPWTRRLIDLTALESEVDHERITPPGRRQRGLYEKIGKRLLDVSLGLLLAILTLPVLIVAILLCGALFGQPPIVRMPTVGKGDRRFQMLRLRTSPVGTRRARAWPRVAGLLRGWALDELPQLWNVVRGHMSLVGPRALRPEEHAGLMEWQQQRLEVKPGVTGLWQVERTAGEALRDTAHYDIQYIDQLSLAADLRILARTLSAVRWLRPLGDARRRTQVKGEILHKRLMAVDVCLWLIAIPAAAWVDLDFSWTEVGVVGLTVGAGAAAFIHLIWASRYGMYRRRWTLTSPESLGLLGLGTAVVTSMLLVTGALLSPLPPRGALLTAGTFYMVGATSARVAAAFAHARGQRSKHSRTGRLLVFGAGKAGIDAAQAVWADEKSPFHPVAFLDDDSSRHRTTVLGLPVLGGRQVISEIARRYDADTMLVAMPSAHPREVSAIVAIAEAAGLDVQTLPPLPQWLSALLVERSRTSTSDSSSDDTAYASDRRPAHRHIRDRGTFDLAVVGLGYVGLPLAIEASRAGLRVCGLDSDASRVEALKAATSVDGTGTEELTRALQDGFVLTTDPSILAQADAVTVSVPTPLQEGLPDLSAVISASETIGEYLRPGQLIVLESTTYPGTTEEVMKPILEKRSGLKAGADFYLAYSPERIDPGNAEWDIHNTPKLVAGINAASTDRAAMLYRKFCPVVTMAGTREAEMAKLLENTYRHVNIALINEMAIFCRQLGVDIWETIRGAATKPFGFQAFYPGPGVGGHCIPIDPNYLSYRVRELGEQFRFIELAQEINQFMPIYAADRAIELLAKHGADPSTSRVLVIGVAYKPDIGDVRETTATSMVRRLSALGVTVEYCDPHVDSFVVDDIPVIRRVDPNKAAADADLTIVHTPHSALNLSEIARSARLIFDLRGTLPGSTHERL